MPPIVVLASSRATEALRGVDVALYRQAIQTCRRAVEWLRKPHLRAMWALGVLRPYEQHAQHFEGVAVILAERLTRLEEEQARQRYDETVLLSEFVRADRLRHSPPRVLDHVAVSLTRERAQAFEHIEQQVHEVGAMIGVISHALQRGSVMIDRIEANVENGDRHLQRGERALLRQHYPVGYERSVCGGWFSRRLVFQVSALVAMFVVAFILCVL